MLVIDVPRRCHAVFEDKYNVLTGMSATGKTYLYEMLSMYCRDLEIPLVKFDWSTERGLEETALVGKKRGFVFVDNWDILVTRERMYSLCIGIATYFICSRFAQNTISLPYGSVGVYAMWNDNGVLTSRKVNAR